MVTVEPGWKVHDSVKLPVTGTLLKGSTSVRLTEQLVGDGPLGDVVPVVVGAAAPATEDVVMSSPAEPTRTAAAPPSRMSVERIPTM